jgi:site-specific DNA recombinase
MPRRPSLSSKSRPIGCSESIERKIAGIVAAVEEGNYSRALGDRLAELERQQELLRARLSETPPSSVRLHPRLADIYAQKVQQLETSLNDPAIREEAADALRSLIDRIELHPGSDGKVAAMLHGDLAQILAICGESDRREKLLETGASGSQLSVVAGTRSHLYRTRFHYTREARK